MKYRLRPGPALLAFVLLGALYVVAMVYAAGQTLLAGTMLAITALALWVYSSAKTYAWRYLFPGIAAALVFVVFPMVYTMAIGFTNYSSRNLLEFPRATQYFLDETFHGGEGASYAFTLHEDGPEFRLRLEDADSGKAWVSGRLALATTTPLEVKLAPQDPAQAPLAEPAQLKAVIARQKHLQALTLVLPDSPNKLVMTGLRQFGAVQPLYKRNADGSLTNQQTHTVLRPNMTSGFYETEAGERVQPGFQVGVGFANYQRIFTDAAFREPFVRIFLWTVVFSALTVFFGAALGMFLAVLFNWDALRFKGLYRTLLFLPYAVPGFISILVFKGLFNQNFGEINGILDAVLGIKPAWFADPLLARTMMLVVNTWLGYPYFLVLCTGLLKAIPVDLYEASAIAGAKPLTNFFRITAPLIVKPLSPLIISAFAYNFNNFVLVSLLTNGRPDFLNTKIPAGTTDILVSYTYRIAFLDSGQNFGLAAAISTVIFFLVALLSYANLRVAARNARK